MHSFQFQDCSRDFSNRCVINWKHFVAFYWTHLTMKQWNLFKEKNISLQFSTSKRIGKQKRTTTFLRQQSDIFKQKCQRVVVPLHRWCGEVLSARNMNWVCVVCVYSRFLTRLCYTNWGFSLDFSSFAVLSATQSVRSFVLLPKSHFRPFWNNPLEVCPKVVAKKSLSGKHWMKIQFKLDS